MGVESIEFKMSYALSGKGGSCVVKHFKIAQFVL